MNSLRLLKEDVTVLENFDHQPTHLAAFDSYTEHQLRCPTGPKQIGLSCPGPVAWTCAG
jgi:hypothetical protein